MGKSERVNKHPSPSKKSIGYSVKRVDEKLRQLDHRLSGTDTFSTWRSS
jgi:hypothetical protein